MLAGNHAKFINNPPRPKPDEQQKYRVVNLLDALFGDDVPQELTDWSITLWGAGQLDAKITRPSDEPTMLQVNVQYGQGTKLTKVQLLKRIATARLWSMTEASIKLTQPQQPVPSALTPTLEHAMQQEGMTVVISFDSEKVYEIGSAIVNGNKLYYAVADGNICVLAGPLHFDWASACPIRQVQITSISSPSHGQRHQTLRLADPMDSHEHVVSSRTMKDLQSALMGDSVCSFFWNRYPVSDDVPDLEDMLYAEDSEFVLTP